MNIKRYKKKNGVILIRGDVNCMAVLAKSINSIFTVREDKVDDFLNVKRDEHAFKTLMARAEMFRKNRKKSN